MSKNITNDSGESDDSIEHKTDNTPALDPRLVDYIQDTPFEDMLVEMDGSKGGKSDKLGLVREWFSTQEDYRPDTYITPQQVYALSLLRNIGGLHKELQPLQPVMNDIIDNLELYAISINGYAREQESNVLRSMFGDKGEITASDRDSMLMNMVAQNQDQENE